jgi:hypothetical protein
MFNDLIWLAGCETGLMTLYGWRAVKQVSFATESDCRILSVFIQAIFMLFLDDT